MKFINRNLFFIIFISLLLSQRISAPITIDGQFEDWDLVNIAYADEVGGESEEDFEIIKISNDNNFLFFYLEFENDEVLMQDWNEIHLFIDADSNSESGYLVHGIGAELDWCFGCKSGQFYHMDGITEIYQNDLTLRIAPTITGTKFEFAIHRESNFLTMDGTQEATNIKLVFQGSGESPDLLPNHSGGIEYEFDSTPVPSPEMITIEKNETEHLRILSYNVWSDGLFNSERQPRFERIISALEPDIMGFQEAYDDNDIEALFEDWLPGVNWHVSNEWNGNYVVSRYPILYQANHSWKSMGVLLDTEDVIGTPLFFINSHFSCCGNNDDRQEQVDELMGFLRDLRNGLGPFTLEEGTPIVHVGDYNLVGYRQQLTTLTDGDIVDEASHGIDFSPDWDNTSLSDLFSRHTHIRMGYTWRKDNSDWNPGKLDYILYTDSVLEPKKHFVLNTMSMPEEDLSLYNLELEDTDQASDHLPRVADFTTAIADTSLSLGFLSGWNLVGVPLNVVDNHYLTLFPSATDGTLYSFNLTYHISMNLNAGEGYWLYFETAGETLINGLVINELLINVNHGWNLISGITNSIQVNDIDDPNELIVAGTVFTFDDVYINASIIEPGKAYWLYSTGSGVLTIINNE